MSHWKESNDYLIELKDCKIVEMNVTAILVLATAIHATSDLRMSTEFDFLLTMMNSTLNLLETSTI